jgi:hypothetical protein
MVNQGATLREVANYLTDSKVPNKSKKPWAIGAISYLLNNPNYIGILVDQSTYDKTMAVLGTRFSPNSAMKGNKKESVISYGDSERIWRLQGLTYCALCGSALTGSQSKGQGGKWYPYLKCTGRLKRGKDFCSAPDLPALACEDMVVEALCLAISSDDVPQHLSKEQSKRTASVAPIREHMKGLHLKQAETAKQLDNLLTLVAEGAVVAQAVVPRIASLQEATNTLATQIAEAEGKLAGMSIGQAELEIMVDTLRSKVADMPSWPWEAQRTTIRGLAKRVELAADQPLKLTLAVDLPAVRENVRKWLPRLDSNQE